MNKEGRDGAMVSTSVRNAGDPWFKSQLRCDRFLCANSFVCNKNIYTALVFLLYTMQNKFSNYFVWVIQSTSVVVVVVVVVVALGFYVPPTAKVIRRRDLGLKSHQILHFIF